MSERRHRRAGAWVLAILAAGCRHPPPSVPPTIAPTATSDGADGSEELDPGPVRYLKGQLHVHTANSPDSQTLPMDVVERYALLGFDFVVFTDHNYTTEFAYPTVGGLLRLTGAELTYNPPACDPPPPLPEGRCRMHMNALFVKRPAPGEMPWTIPEEEITDITRVGLYQRHLDAVKRLDGIAMLNHPTWHWGTDGDLLTELAGRGVLLVEIANAGFEAWREGADGFPGTEAIWDQALSAGHTIWGVASDDAHHYGLSEIVDRIARGQQPYPPGLGWVMVRAQKSEPSIRAAIERGDFYSSTGIELTRAEVADGALVVEAAPATPAPCAITFIGMGGAVLRRADTCADSFPLEQARGGYVRAVIRDAEGHRAWVQPVRVPP